MLYRTDKNPKDKQDQTNTLIERHTFNEQAEHQGKIPNGQQIYGKERPSLINKIKIKGSLYIIKLEIY